MTKTQESLRIASRAFRIMALGGKFTLADLKLFGDMCALALPMRYRFNKDELAEQAQYAESRRALDSMDEIALFLDECGISAFEPTEPNKCPMMYTMLERIKMLAGSAQPGDAPTVNAGPHWGLSNLPPDQMKAHKEEKP